MLSFLQLTKLLSLYLFKEEEVSLPCKFLQKQNIYGLL